MIHNVNNRTATLTRTDQITTGKHLCSNKIRSWWSCWTTCGRSQRPLTDLQTHCNIIRIFQITFRRTHKKQVITNPYQETNFYKPNTAAGLRKWMQLTSYFNSSRQLDGYPLSYLFERHNNDRKTASGFSVMPFQLPIITRIYCVIDWSRKGTN